MARPHGAPVEEKFLSPLRVFDAEPEISNAVKAGVQPLPLVSVAFPLKKGVLNVRDT